MNAVELTGVKKTIGRLNLNIDKLNIPQGKITGIYGIKPVSYTHLDEYKRQIYSIYTGSEHSGYC